MTPSRIVAATMRNIISGFALLAVPCIASSQEWTAPVLDVAPNIHGAVVTNECSAPPGGATAYEKYLIVEYRCTPKPVQMNGFRYYEHSPYLHHGRVIERLPDESRVSSSPPGTIAIKGLPYVVPRLIELR